MIRPSSSVLSTTDIARLKTYLTAKYFTTPPTGPTAQVSFEWGGVQYAKVDPIPAFRESQMRHLRQRGYANTAATLVVGKPFTHGGTAYARGTAIPTGLTDAQLRRLVAGRYLV